MADRQADDLLWQALLTGELPALRRGRFVLKFLPSEPRCKMCNAPFRGIGAPLMRMVGRGPARGNPRFCGFCERIAQRHPGGTEIELSLLFADVRGSTDLAEPLRPAEFGRLLNRFYDQTTRVLIDSDALIDKLVGDAVIGLYFPGFAGAGHARQAIRAAQRLREENGAGLPIGIAVHTGTVYAGIVGSSDTFVDFTVLGDAVNIAARLASAAGPGEILISAAAYRASKLDISGLDRRTLALRGHRQPVEVEVWSGA